MQKPRIFVASAVESLDVANAVNLNLDHDAEVTVWKDGFKISTDNIGSLLDRARASDFAVFIFTPDDVTTIRRQEKLVVRDNVLFELGLFVGSLGKERCFIVKPRGVDLHIPTDLLGLTPADYEAARSDRNLAAAVNALCTLIRERVAEKGLLPQDIEPATPQRRVARYDYTVGQTEMLILARLTSGHISNPEGVSTWQIMNDLHDVPEHFAALGLVKLERLGLIERTIQDGQDSEYYCFALTADGLDHVLEHEAAFVQTERSGAQSKGAPGAGDEFGDDIPF